VALSESLTGPRPFRPGTMVQVLVRVGGETKNAGEIRVGEGGELDFSPLDLDIVMVGIGHDGEIHAPRLVLGDEESRMRELDGVNLERLDVISRVNGVLPVEAALEDARGGLTTRELVAKYRGELPRVVECPMCRRPMPRRPGRPKRQGLGAA
jgi:hypothetical protein